MENKILNLLYQGFTQHEISEILKKEKIYPNSISYIEKKINKIKKDYSAKTLFQLGVIYQSNQSKNL